MATFTGTAGNDVLPPVGGNNSGADTMEGLRGNDTLRGGTGSDTLEGEAGDDLLDGGSGADTFRGGAGTDLVSYYGGAVAVQVNLTNNVNHGGDAEGDNFQDAIEIVHGSLFADTLLGLASAQTLRGLAGNDVLRGQAGDDGLEGGDGDDQLDGGDGADTLAGGAGADRLFGGAGTDTVSYADSGGGVSLNLATNVNRYGTAEGDRFLDHIALAISVAAVVAPIGVGDRRG